MRLLIIIVIGLIYAPIFSQSTGNPVLPDSVAAPEIFIDMGETLKAEHAQAMSILQQGTNQLARIISIVQEQSQVPEGYVFKGFTEDQQLVYGKIPPKPVTSHEQKE